MKVPSTIIKLNGEDYISFNLKDVLNMKDSLKNEDGIRVEKEYLAQFLVNMEKLLRDN